MNQKFKYIALVVLLSFAQPTFAFKLSPQAEISVMTLGPYQGELYSAFGHSAFRVYDPALNIDVVYNYGVFDFKQKNFYLNFIRGKMLYKLGLARYNWFKQNYIKENRFVYEQVLNLTADQKQTIIDFLENNYKPENKNYYYNYAYDNCSSKIRDVLKTTLGDNITLDTSYVEEGLTFRGLMDRYTTYQYWGDFGIDLGLGMGVDKPARGEEYMFMPDYLFRSLEKSSIKDSVGFKPLVLKLNKVYEAKEEKQETPFLTPFNFFTILFFIIGFITNINFKKDKRTKWVDTFFFGITGLTGFFLLFLWFGTDHISQWNLNLLWALPSHLIVVFLINKVKYRKFVRAYFKWASIFYVLLIFVWGFLLQPIHTSLVPFVLMLTLRGFYMVHSLRK